MTPRVLVFVEDPGAANGVIGLPRALRARAVDVHVVATGVAETYLDGKLDQIERLASGVSADALLDRERPTAVLVGTSENPDTLGLALVDAARRRGVPTVGFVDALANAEHRFRGRADAPLAHCPELVLVPDSWTKDAFTALGLAAERVGVTGHPLYDAVLARAAELEREGKDAVRARAFPNAPHDVRVVTFASEISTGLDPAQFQRSPAYTLHGRGTRHGRTEIVLEELAAALCELHPRPYFVLRLHPKNTLEELGALVAEADHVSREGPALDVAYASDLVAGMTSTILLEAALLGRPTLSIVPRALERDWLPTTRSGITRAATTREELRSELRAWTGRPNEPVRAFATAGALDRMADVLAELARASVASINGRRSS